MAGYEFQRSRWEGGAAPDAFRSRPLQGGPRMEGFARGNLLATYAHIHFAGAPGWAEHGVDRLRQAPLHGTRAPV